MAWLILIVVNIPVYLLIGWLIFDSREIAAETFFGTVLAILKIAFVPPLVRVMLGWDDDHGELGIFPIIAFFIACGALTFGEYWLLTKYVFIPPNEMATMFIG